MSEVHQHRAAAAVTHRLAHSAETAFEIGRHRHLQLAQAQLKAHVCAFLAGGVVDCAYQAAVLSPTTALITSAPMRPRAPATTTGIGAVMKAQQTLTYGSARVTADRNPRARRAVAVRFFTLLSAQMFTQVRSADRRVAPVEGQNHKSVMKAVYVVLEPQYQNALTQAATALNASGGDLRIELSSYLIEELRDDDNYAAFCADVAEADVFVASLIFIEDLAQKVVDAVAPHRDRLKAAVGLPLDARGDAAEQAGRLLDGPARSEQGAIAGFMKKRKEAGGAGFQDAMLKLLNTLPTVLKYLPVEKAQDARSFMLSFQYWLGEPPDNLRNFLLMLADKYVFLLQKETGVQRWSGGPRCSPTLVSGTHSPSMFEDLKEYLNWTSAAPICLRRPARAGDRSGAAAQPHRRR